MFAIEWRPRAVRQLRRIREAESRAAIVRAVGMLRVFPHVESVVALKAHRYDYRLRVGRHRVLFDVHPEAKTIVIQDVRKRDEHTY